MSIKKEKLLDSTYKQFLNSIHNLVYKSSDKFISEGLMAYGTAVDEKMFSLSDFRKQLDKERKFSEGITLKVRDTPVFRKITEGGDSAVIVGEYEIEMKSNGEVHFLDTRITTVLEYKGEKWKVIHFHVAKVDKNMSVEDPFHYEELKRKNDELEKIVNARTEELEKRNAELEIETSLERVRSRAMSMSKPEALTGICEILFDELIRLSFPDVRNTQINIFNNAKRTFTNYDYADYAGASITEVSYDLNPIVKAFLTNAAKSPDAFVEFKIGKKEIEGWKKMRLKLGEMPDPKLEKIDSLYYYFYSIGSGSIGLSTFKSLPEEHLKVLKRFRNVFDLAYRRYVDIKTAQAHARETQIELSLERIRARSMSMHSSEELVDASDVFFNQLLSLGIESIRTGVGLFHNEGETIEVWSRSHNDMTARSKILGIVPRDTNEFFRKCFDAWKNKEKFFIYELKGANVKKYYLSMKTTLTYPEKKAFNDKEYFNIFFFEEGSLNVVSRHKLSEEEISLMLRFAGVFGLVYRRFLDLKRAEAQAREANIEASLERVRAAAMSIQKSDQLSFIGEKIFGELKSLGFNELRNTEIIINNDPKESVTSYYYSDYGVSGIIEIFYKEHLKVKSWADEMRKAGDAFAEIIIGENEIKEWRKYRESIGYLPDRKLNKASTVYYYSYSIGLGALSISSFAEISEDQKKIIHRFRNVFNLAYQRYSDVSLAEAQTRRANIETALERVRARSLAMQEPEELVEVIKVLRNEMGILRVEELETSTVFVWDMNSDKAECWFAVKDEKNTERELIADYLILELNVTAFGRVLKKFFDSGIEEERISICLKGADRKEWIEYVYKISSVFRDFFGKEIPDRMFHLYKYSHGAIGVTTSAEISEESWDLLQRATSVFSLAYSRFKDLSQAKKDLELLKEEKKRSDSLLLNILPEEIAAELKEFGKSYARKHDEVSILFADIRGFSTIAERLSASELVTQLDECFRAFDYIVEKHGLEKIKTVGDAYVCACGLPKPVEDNAVKTVNAAMDMMDFIRGFAMTKKIQDLPPFEFRIGIHTGPVVTGVVGLKKFTYDIWGDAVNMAARMEQNSEVGKINISESTFKLVKDKFKCIHRGCIEAKNKGLVDMYFVEMKN